MKIKKGDKVKIILGKDRGREGQVEKVFPKSGKVLVAGLNLYKKHVRPKKEGEKGGVVEISRPLAVSKVALICPKCGQPTRVGYQLSGKEKIRICRKCKEII